MIEFRFIEFHVKETPLQTQSNIHAAARCCVCDRGKRNSLGSGECFQTDSEHITRGDDLKGRTWCSSLFLKAEIVRCSSSPALGHRDARCSRSSRGCATKSCDTNDSIPSLHDTIRATKPKLIAFGAQDAIQQGCFAIMRKGGFSDHPHCGNCDQSQFSVSTDRRR